MQLVWWVHRQIFSREDVHLGIVLFLAASVDVAAAAKASDVAVELWANVIQLVQNGDELFLERLLQKPWQIEREDVVHLTFVEVQSLDRPLLTIAHRCERAVLKPHRSELGLQSVENLGSRLGKTDSHARHVDVEKRFVAVRDVLAQMIHRVRKIERT